MEGYHCGKGTKYVLSRFFVVSLQRFPIDFELSHGPFEHIRMAMGEILEMISNGLDRIDVDIIRILEFTPELIRLFAYRDTYRVVLYASVE